MEDDQCFWREAHEIRLLATVIGKISRQELEQRLASEGVGLGALPFGVLHVIHDRHAHTIKEVSEIMMLTPATLVPAVDALERHGYLTRSKDIRDRRRVTLQITEAGHRVLRQTAPLHRDDSFVNALVALGEEQRKALHGLLREVIANMPDGPMMLQNLDGAAE